MGDGFSSGIGGGSNTSGRTARHTLIDFLRHLYFGYDVAVDRVGKKNRFRLTFSALNATPQEMVIDLSRIPLSAKRL